METRHLRAVVTGASGWIGFELCQAWLARYGPHSVIAMTGPVQHGTERQRRDALRQLPVSEVPLDLRRLPVFRDTIDDFDVLFHLAAFVRTEDDSPEVRINDTGTRWLLEALGERLRNKHVVFASSISAVDSTYTKDGRMTPETEPSPRTEYGRSKLTAEAIVKEESARLGFTYTILRLPIVYGPGYRPHGIFDFFTDQLPKATLGGRIAWPGKISLVEVEDAASILVQMAESDKLHGKTFFVSSAEDPCMTDMAKVAAACLGVEHRPLVLPKPLFKLMNTVGKRLSTLRFLPHSMRILAWRVSLVVDGYSCDGTELNELLGMKHSSWRDSFHRMFAPPGKSAAAAERAELARNPGLT